MDMSKFACLPEGSICEKCRFCMSRLIEPLDEEAFEIISQGDDEQTVLVHSLCLMSDIDLNDHVVKVCNKFDDGTGGNPFFANKFLNL